MSVAGGVPKNPIEMVAGALCLCANEIVTDIDVNFNNLKDC